ncbi:helix-turn-helix domain-containing protein [Paenibacillus cymbidii]|uniref:helix-turn-helix domain-containing protein n=1 Tax=Paenibacillus cymbidii TaxID=1639034 RepID=UPI001081D799|nr:helix-turn-helix transcriptional regulator [Paenibacillus cymbidii]
MDVLNAVGERIRNYRKERKWTQQQLAEKANVNESYVGKVERGERNVTIDSLLKITGALEITLEQLFKNIQSNRQSRSNEVLTEIINRLHGRNLKEQQKILAIIDLVINDK